MTTKNGFALRLLAAAALIAPAPALATAGYFQLGYGLKAKGMGGVGVALPQDSLAAATNPAGMAWIGTRLDAGLERFVADRGSEIVGNTEGLSGTWDANGVKSFWVPEAGANWAINSRAALGLSLYGNGGMTEYRSSPLRSLFGSSEPAGLNFVQVVAAPTLAMKLGESHSLGVSLNFVWQRFEARGFQYFDDRLFSASPGSVTNRGADWASGIGWRIGWLSKLTDSLSLGAAYQPKIHMERFDAYRGLLARQGNFDSPANYTVGLAWQASPQLTLAADAQRIDYAKVPSMGQTVDCFFPPRACLLGQNQGPGSGWRNVTVYKLGAAYAWSPALTLRAGFATLRQPIPAGQTLLGVFAPAVSENHLTAGATWALDERLELTVFWMHAFENTVNGSRSIPPGAPTAGIGGGEANLRMRQDALGIALGWRL